jgi:hypothetical protein
MLKCYRRNDEGKFQSNVNSQQRFDTPQRNIGSHTTPHMNAQLASEPRSEPLETSTWVNTSVSSGQLQTQNIPHTVNMPPYYTGMYLHPPRLAPVLYPGLSSESAVFRTANLRMLPVHCMSDGSIRTSTDAQSSLSMGTRQINLNSPVPSDSGAKGIE